jgi:translation initiation factor 6
MNFQKFSLNGTPFIGVFGAVTEKIGLFPLYIKKKEKKKIEDTLEVEVIKTSIAETSLIGVLVKGNSKGFVVPETIEEKELNELTEIGLKIKKNEWSKRFRKLDCIE